MSDVTQILGQIEDGDGQAAEKLLPLVYDEGLKLAAAKMAQRRSGTDAASYGTGPRGVYPAGGYRKGPALGFGVATSLRLRPRPCGGSWWMAHRKSAAKRTPENKPSWT